AIMLFGQRHSANAALVQTYFHTAHHGARTDIVVIPARKRRPWGGMALRAPHRKSEMTTLQPLEKIQSRRCRFVFAHGNSHTLPSCNFWEDLIAYFPLSH